MRRSSLEDVTIISNEASKDLAIKVAAEMGVPFTEVDKGTFADGEIHHTFSEGTVQGRDVVIVGSTHNDASQMEVMDLIAGSQFWRAGSVSLVVPYLGYSTMERAKNGEIPKGLTRTRQLLGSGVDFAAFVDLHAEAVMHTHDGRVRTAHIQTDDLVLREIQGMGIPADQIVLVSPDHGRAKWVAKIAKKGGFSHFAADKDRFDKDRVSVGQISDIVKGRFAIVCDDMIRTGSSMALTAIGCREAGAKDVGFQASHLVLAGNAREKLRNAGASVIMGSDTFPGIKSDGFVRVYSSAALIAQNVKDQLGIAAQKLT